MCLITFATFLTKVVNVLGKLHKCFQNNDKHLSTFDDVLITHCQISIDVQTTVHKNTVLYRKTNQEFSSDLGVSVFLR